MPTSEETEATDGAALIAAERERQVGEEGWTPGHDDEHHTGQLRRAAMRYLLAPGVIRRNAANGKLTPPNGWPFEAEAWKPTGDAIRDLTKAGALIAAEIDRLQREATHA
jgi:hypothetical protein